MNSSAMIDVTGQRSAPKVSPLVAVVTTVGLLGALAACSGNRARPSLLPRVTTITQVTRDAASKTSLLSDDSHLYVTEWSAGHQVITRLSLQGSDRTIIPSPFSGLRALDLSSDHTQLLVSPSGLGDNEFWTVPAAAGSPQRVGDLTGRDASWSDDGRQHYLEQGV